MLKKIGIIGLFCVAGMHGMQPEDKSGKNSKSLQPASPTGSRISRTQRGSRDLSPLKDVLNKLAKSDEHSEQELETRYTQAKALQREVRERIINEVLNSELYKGCGARLKFVELQFEDRMHDAQVALANIKSYKSMLNLSKYKEEISASIGVHHKAYYMARIALIEKLLCQDSKKQLYMHEWDADMQLRTHWDDAVKEISSINA